MPLLTITLADLEGSGPILDVEVGNSLTGRQALQRQKQPVPPAIQVRALVDTGSDMSVIDDGLANRLSLTLIGFQFLAGGGGAAGLAPGMPVAPEYSARVQFPHGPAFDLTVLEIALPGGLQMLIGRDVLARGLFIYAGMNESFTLGF
jgi:hypothetical protein